MYIICIKDLISNKWRQVMIPLIESSIIMNPNNMYMICIIITQLENKTKWYVSTISTQVSYHKIASLY